MTDSSKLRQQIAAFKFAEALLDGNWNNPARSQFCRTVQDRELVFSPIAEVGGVVAIEVTEPTSGDPAIVSPQARNLRRSVDAEIAKEIHEHILVFINSDRTEAVWHFSKVVQGKRLHREYRLSPRTPLEPLARLLRGVEVPYTWLDSTGELSHVLALDMMDQAGLYAEKVSKKFYTDLEKERKVFEPFLKWVKDEEKRSWYVTVLLNRLMFIYFIQHRGLMGGDTAYLRQRLNECMAQGTDRFYADFFLPLCFFGFGKQAGERGRFEETFKGVPYLNGGIFSVHEVEEECGVTAEALRDCKLPADAVIPDAEFERWFKFFDSWRWTLDEANPDNDRQISPDILGYIFEKYINQKQMGAYYTKEDITGYICRNTIIPRLFDMLAETGHKGKQAVDPLPIGPHPNLLNDGKGISGGIGIDRYIYNAVKTLDRLPTETDREFDARQKRYDSILQDFDDGKITTVNDFITWNLDMELMAADFVSTIQDAEVLRDFYFTCLKTITVLDPTCGSGAFLFAALRILYPLYQRCLTRMAAMCAEVGDPAHDMTWKGEMGFANEVSEQLGFLDSQPHAQQEIVAQFRKEIAEIEAHPNPEYFVYKTIIVNNLFGVDIMDEAVEICKLRLFLKLIAHAEPDGNKPNHGIEPLPNIDFNILAGNTLVGYTSFEDINEQWKNVEQVKIGAKDGAEVSQGAMAFEKEHTKLRRLVGQYGDDLKMFREFELGLRSHEKINMEQMALTRAAAKDELDRDLWSLYKDAGKRSDKLSLKKFQDSVHPFHWFLEFPEVMKSKGFDVIVGNPPYVEYTKKDAKTRTSVKDSYQILGYMTETCGNLYAFAAERVAGLVRTKGKTGLIIPVASVCTDGYVPLQRLLLSTGNLNISNFNDRPGKLFDGLEHIRLSIILCAKGANPAGKVFTTRYNRWLTVERPVLFHRLQYAECTGLPSDGSVPKLSSNIETSILKKVLSQGKRLSSNSSLAGEHCIYYTRKLSSFVQILDFVPTIYDKQGQSRDPSELKALLFDTRNERDVWLAVLNSSLFFWWLTVHSDCRNLNSREINSVRMDIGTATPQTLSMLSSLASDLMVDFKENSKLVPMKYEKLGVMKIQCIYPKQSKPIIDEIDRVLAKHYGFTDEELDFIINYDIKYRMGRDAEEETE